MEFFELVVFSDYEIRETADPIGSRTKISQPFWILHEFILVVILLFFGASRVPELRRFMGENFIAIITAYSLSGRDGRKRAHCGAR